MSQKITLKPAIHKKTPVVCVYFDYNDFIINKLRRMEAKWSATLKCWYFYKEAFSLKTFYKQLQSYAFIDYKELIDVELKKEKASPKPLKEQLPEDLKLVANTFYNYLRGKRYSTSTLRTYTYLVAEFLVHHKSKTIDTKREIEEFVEKVFIIKNVSISTHRQFVSAMNHYLVFIQADFRLDFKIDAPQKDKKLPNVLSKQEIVRLIQVTKNLKHRVCITLLYSSGLRIGELLSLELKHIDFERNLLRIEMSKGRKDRYVPIAKSILPMLHNYLNTYKTKKFLIENDVHKIKYSSNSIRKFLKVNLKKAHITKYVTPHTLRHSYGTHLLENGTDIRYIQQLLGHNDPKTTMIYTHVQSEALQKIKNPLDLIVLQYNNQKKIT